MVISVLVQMGELYFKVSQLSLRDLSTCTIKNRLKNVYSATQVGKILVTWLQCCVFLDAESSGVVIWGLERCQVSLSPCKNLTVASLCQFHLELIPHRQKHPPVVDGAECGDV